MRLLEKIPGYRRRNREGRSAIRQWSEQWPRVERRQTKTASDAEGLKLLSYNIQSGIGTTGMHRYVTESWKHILPHSEQLGLLKEIARVAHDYDLVGIQEADVGSLRTGYVNQAEYIARCAGFEHWHAQTNRRVSQLATSAVAAMSRAPLRTIREARLPGKIPGRGALIVTLEGAEEDLTVAIVHLALGRRDRLHQLSSLVRHLPEKGPMVLMGDFNCIAEGPEFDLLYTRCGLRCADAGARRTFPSWRPVRGIDHILVTEGLNVVYSDVLDYTWSDHRPVAVTVDWKRAKTDATSVSLNAAA